MKIGFQGEEGAYSEEAIYRHFGKEAETKGFMEFDDAFDALAGGVVDLIAIPIENTTYGSISSNYDRLLEGDFFIHGEIFLRIRHHLLAIAGSSINKIKNVYSHPAALGQCRKFIREKGWRSFPVYDTAGATRIVNEKGDLENAAIASRLCAEIYGLKIIKEDVQMSENNTTRFFIVGRGNAPDGLRKEKTSLAFSVKHRPGGLITALQRLSKNDVNMTKLESRPMPENPWEYIFFADVEGGIDDKNVRNAISEMEAASAFVKVLGSYPKGKED